MLGKLGMNTKRRQKVIELTEWWQVALVAIIALVVAVFLTFLGGYFFALGMNFVIN